MKALVTGAGGFIGSYVVQQLSAQNFNVRALVHYNSKGEWGHLREIPSGLMERVDVQLGDITDARLVNQLVAGCDVVYHLAALIGIPYSYSAPASYVATNIGGTLNILEACRGAKIHRVVVTSTSEVYGTACYTPIDEQHPLQAQSPYAATKIAADKLAQSYFLSFDLPVVVLRPFNTFGPRQSARAIIPTVITQALTSQCEIKLGNLEPKRDLTFVEDTARAFVLAGQVPGIEGEVIHFGNGKAVSIGELATRCLSIVGSEARIISDTERLRPNKSEVELLLCNPAKAKALLGWAPEISLDAGLQRVADYMRDHLDLYQTSRYTV